MSAPPSGKGEPIENRAQLVEYLAQGSKPKDAWRIGTEHEKFAFTRGDFRPLPYEGDVGIRAILEGMASRFGWEVVREAGNPIALVKDRCSVTLEPGGQFELSGAPLETIHQTCAEVHEHLEQVRAICEPMRAGMMGMGFNPKWARDQIPVMPKGRYQIMRNYMPKRGKLGLDMMLRTCTIQVNLDYSSEADMVKKFQVSLALQPIATALFANSPFSDRKPNGYLSYRSHIWTDTDPDRCGVLPFVFEDGMGFERYVDYLLDVPMYFVYRDGVYIDASGQSFRDFMDGRLAALPGEKPIMTDWVDHLTTAFPEVRLKRFLEMRGADGGPWQHLCALPALWVGLLYDQTSLDAAADIVRNWTVDDHNYLRAEVPRTALGTSFHGGSVRGIAREMLEIATEGLKARARKDWQGLDESHYLSALEATVASGRTPAEMKLESFYGPWQGNVDRIYVEQAY